MDDIKNNNKYNISMNKEGRRLAILSLGLNIIITVVKYLLYLITSSSALLAETIHSLTDVVGGFFVLFGIYFSDKKLKRFPWGLYKIENIGSLLMAAMIVLSALGIVKTIYMSSPVDTQRLDIVLVSLLLMVIPILLFAKYEESRAKILNSPLLLADAQNWKMDVAPIVIVAFGIIGVQLSFPIMDKIAAVLILVFIVKACYDIIKDSLQSLLDASVDNETLDKIKRITLNFPHVEDIVSVQARNAGRFIFVNMNLVISLDDFQNAHKAADSISNKIKEQMPFVESVVIHYEPVDKGYSRYAALIENNKKQISNEFGCAPYISIWDIDVKSKSVLSYNIDENPFCKDDNKKGISLVNFFINNKVDILYVRKLQDFSQGVSSILSKASIEVRSTEHSLIDNLVNDINS